MKNRPGRSSDDGGTSRVCPNQVVTSIINETTDPEAFAIERALFPPERHGELPSPSRRDH